MKKRWWEKISFRTAALLHALLAAGCFLSSAYAFRQPPEGDWRFLAWWFLLCAAVCAGNARGAWRERHRDGEEER